MATLLFETEWSIIFRGAVDSTDLARQRTKRSIRPKVSRPHFHVELATTPEQALLYRLVGRSHSLHADPAFASVGLSPRSILHGFCTYGFVARAIAKGACGGDATASCSSTVSSAARFGPATRSSSTDFTSNT